MQRIVTNKQTEVSFFRSSNLNIATQQKDATILYLFMFDGSSSMKIVEHTQSYAEVVKKMSQKAIVDLRSQAKSDKTQIAFLYFSDKSVFFSENGKQTFSIQEKLEIKNAHSFLQGGNTRAYFAFRDVKDFLVIQTKIYPSLHAKIVLFTDGHFSELKANKIDGKHKILEVVETIKHDIGLSTCELMSIAIGNDSNMELLTELATSINNNKQCFNLKID